jgi:hypothetical protein
MAAAVLLAGAAHAVKSTPAPAVPAPPPPASPPPDSNAYWGPRLWRVFHTLAEYSDRRDVSALWRNVLRITAQTMPCQKCRAHLMEYMRTHSMFQSSPIMPIREIQNRIRRDIYTLHNAVNKRNNAPEFEFSQLTSTYASKPRPEGMNGVHMTLNELKNAWTPLVHTRIQPAAFSQWKHAVDLLCALISSGPQK